MVGFFPWSDEGAMLDAVNAVDFGLTAAVYTKDVSAALRWTAATA